MAESNHQAVKKRKSVLQTHGEHVLRPCKDAGKGHGSDFGEKTASQGKKKVRKDEDLRCENSDEIVPIATGKRLKQDAETSKISRKRFNSQLVKQDADTSKNPKKRLNSRKVLYFRSCYIETDSMTMVTKGNDIKYVIFPPYDLAATTLEAAFPLHKIISADEWEYLMGVSEFSYPAAKFANRHRYCPEFVRKRLHKLSKIKDATEKRKLACIFTYIRHLVIFWHKLIGSNIAWGHEFPDVLSKRFSSLFTLTKHLGEYKLIIFYVVVLSLHVDNFRTNLDDLCVDTGCFHATLADYCRHLGCDIVESETHSVATLSLPLRLSKFPWKNESIMQSPPEMAF